MPKIIDAITFFNEVDLLNIRLHELYTSVDNFVIVEAATTFTGDRKPSIFLQHRDAFAWAASKIEYLFLEQLPEFGAPERYNRARFEAFQRNSIMLGIEKLSVQNDDVILISDLDEIPRASLMSTIAAECQRVALIIVEQKLTKFFLNNISDKHANGQQWLGTVALRYKTLKAALPQGIRIGDPFFQRAGRVTTLSPLPPKDYGASYKVIPDGGWHLSYMGGFAAFAAKAANMVDRHDMPYAALPANSVHSIPNMGPVIDSRAVPSRHNYADFRRQHEMAIASVMESLAPALHPVNWPLDNISLDLPDYLLKNANEYEHLFYLDHPIDERTT